MEDDDDKNGKDPVKPDDEAKNKSEEENDDEPVVSMTQAKYDKMLAGKAKQGKRAAVNDILESLGAKSIDELKAIMAAKAEAEDAEKTDSEKLQGAHDTLEGKLQTALAEVGTLKTQLVNDAIKNALIHQARAAGAQHPEDVAVMALTLPGEHEAYADDQIDSEVIEELVKAVKKQRESWFGEAQALQGNPPHDKGREPGADDKASTKAALERAWQRTKGGFN